MSAQPDVPGPSERDTGTPAESDPEVRHLHSVEDTPDEAPPEGGTTTEAEATVDDEGQDQPGRIAAARGFLATAFIPASGLYTDRQPSIAETVRRARAGGQLPDSGPLRTASTVYGYGAAGVGAVCDSLKWAVAHPARLGLFVALVTLALLFPPVRHVAGYLLTPFVWAHAALL